MQNERADSGEEVIEEEVITDEPLEEYIDVMGDVSVSDDIVIGGNGSVQDTRSRTVRMQAVVGGETRQFYYRAAASNSVQTVRPISRFQDQTQRASSSRLYTPITRSAFIQQIRPASQQHVYTVRGNQVFRLGTPTSVRVADQRMNETKPAYVRMRTDSFVPRPILKQPVKGSLSARTIPPVSNSSDVSSSRIVRPATNESVLTPFLASKVAQAKKRPIGGRKPCHCTRSMCLKLYCECFANGEFCNDCDCRDCHNTIEFESERSRAIKLSLERNPNAFKPKIGVASRGQIENERMHQKGCHCKKSNCLKNYCECYEAKVPCTPRCKCISCRNTDADRAVRFPQAKPSMSLTELHSSLPTASRSDSPDASSRSEEESEGENPEPNDPKTLPWFYMTDEVIEAATLCLVAQAEDVESTGKASRIEIERAILQEFGRCLGQVIESAARNGHKPAPES